MGEKQSWYLSPFLSLPFKFSFHLFLYLQTLSKIGCMCVLFGRITAHIRWWHASRQVNV